MKPESPIWSLVAGKFNNELTEEEKSQLDKFTQNEQDRKLMNRVETIHSGVNEMKHVRSFDKNVSWNKIGNHIRMMQVRKHTIVMLKYVAILVLAFGLGAVFNSVLLQRDIPVQYAEVEVTYGQTNHLVLFDGTEVWLNSGTKFKYPNRFNSSERDVYVTGEAFFKVAPNKKLPFKVRTGRMEIEVLGTSFNVSAYPNDSVQFVVLVEGKVQLNNAQGNKIGELVPGQLALQMPDKKIFVQNVSPSEYTNWKDGILNFREERMEDIAKKLERWYNVEISFEKENLKEHLITGTILRNKPIDQITSVLEMIAPIKFEYVIKAEEKNKLIVTER
ncbi:MAG: hypothetical protein A2W90_16145 [Bacteroidetes bacterium GWF2_42_66]|nr:MAG: hypothetical protein A2W92_08830 [Bacteroidetes bacterium GWA2_42_15]OFX96231.1 MAG: hypothetical protein A2W89_05075 [Bacteroidetes bacterium GWE2_42_39]OFY46270.1 MAG: hypothetical protein A2W90_16145 [Bacteroidetes bacterium GWF2_42_66]HAZ02596.1 hypothetical protein [Marinilabiliales bacterium]HBL78353.1 hypothetical protein [Prolixibacteraceae bacterium]